MIPLPSGTKIWLVAGITDMRNVLLEKRHISKILILSKAGCRTTTTPLAALTLCHLAGYGKCSSYFIL
ncbi:TPA: hypothetical protein HNC36_23135 [Escherichia coli]|nr:hypothetical protein [Escherichia coli]EFN4373518.1 hypothetical protein [Escherichia coli]EFN4421151.1 hypothetical protein [Escherichia coli]EFN5058239.1 hypothetical protein [Escherichia coli]EFN5073559.1 hypothetical protein [Escherichia coli]